MNLRVLGCAGAEFPKFHPPGFLIDDSLLFDAGTIGAVLDEKEQWAIRHIFVTHAHLDHIRGIPALADNIITSNRKHNVRIYGTGETIASLRQHLMNNVIWPDFTCLPSTTSPVISYVEITPGKQVSVNGYDIIAYPVNHTIPAVGYLVRSNRSALLYTGDTGPTGTIWTKAAGLTALIVEVSFPNDMEEIALLTGHLTPHLLGAELKKLTITPTRILITHPKPQYYPRIRAELEGMGIPGMEMLSDGSRYSF